MTNSSCEQSILDRFDEMVKQHGDRPAVCDGDRSISYTELAQASRQVAQTLHRAESDPSKPIAFLVGHSLEQVVCLMGILRSGCPYIPLDPWSPKAALEQMIAQAGIEHLIAHGRGLKVARTLSASPLRIIPLDETFAEDASPTEDLPIAPDAIANIYYTSGSTGLPKGVMQSHRNMVFFAHTLAQLWSVTPDDRIAHIVPATFSGASMTLFAALLNGAQLHLLDLRLHRMPDLAAWLLDKRITIFFSVPSMFRQLMNALDSGTVFDDLRLVVNGGEALRWDDVIPYWPHFPQTCRRHCILAAAEMQIVCCTSLSRNQEALPESPIVPVGHSLAEKEVLILTEEGTTAAPGEIGEIVIRSAFLSPGYWNRPDLTEKAFKEDPDHPNQRMYYTGDLGTRLPDGSLCHLGRRDDAVKIRGQKVLPGSIEEILRQIPSVKEAVVLGVPHETGTLSLIAYIVAKDEQTFSTLLIRNALSEQLPGYMIPGKLIAVKHIPKTSSGKIDRIALMDAPQNTSSQ